MHHDERPNDALVPLVERIGAVNQQLLRMPLHRDPFRAHGVRGGAGRHGWLALRHAACCHEPEQRRREETDASVAPSHDRCSLRSCRTRTCGPRGVSVQPAFMSSASPTCQPPNCTQATSRCNSVEQVVRSSGAGSQIVRSRRQRAANRRSRDPRRWPRACWECPFGRAPEGYGHGSCLYKAPRRSGAGAARS